MWLVALPPDVSQSGAVLLSTLRFMVMSTLDVKCGAASRSLYFCAITIIFAIHCAAMIFPITCMQSGRYVVQMYCIHIIV